MEEMLYLLWLTNLPEISCLRAHALMEHFGSAQAVYAASTADYLEVEGISPSMAQALNFKSLDGPRGILEACDALGVDILNCYGDDRYPQRLKDIPDPPLLLYMKGHLPEIDGVLALSVVGSRKPSAYGTNMAVQFAHDLTKMGCLIVSGMARGIDTAAHRGALKADGKTVAVLGCGPDVVYPKENAELKRIIEANGAVLSEYPPGTPPYRANFPARNRIICGLGVGTLLVEGKASSGSCITGRLTLDQGKEVFCIPGNLDNPLSVGPHSFVRDGARLVTCAKDIVLDLQSQFPNMTLEAPQSVPKDDLFAGLNEDQRRVAKVLSASTPVHIDEICHKSGIEIAVANQALTMLELSGLVASLPGKQYILKQCTLF